MSGKKRGRPLGSRNVPKIKPIDSKKTTGNPNAKKVILFGNGATLASSTNRPGRKRKHPIVPFQAETVEDFKKQLDVAEKMSNQCDIMENVVESMISRTVEEKRDSKRKREKPTTRSSYQEIGPPPARASRKDVARFGMLMRSITSQLRKMVATTGSHVLLYVIPPHSVDHPGARAESKECLFHHGNIRELLVRTAIATKYHQSTAEEKMEWEIAYEAYEKSMKDPNTKAIPIVKPIHPSVSNIFNTELAGPNPFLQTADNTGPYPPVRAQQTLTHENYMLFPGFLPGQKVEAPRTYNFGTFETNALMSENRCFDPPPPAIL